MTLTKSQLIGQMHDRLEGYTRSEVVAALNVLVEVVTENVADGEKVTIPGLCTFSTKEVPARKAGMYPNPFKRDPETGEKMMEHRPARPKSKKVAVRAVKAIKDAVA